MNATKPILPSFSKLPKTYEALCRLHLPRTLHDEIELDAVTEIIDPSTASRLLRGERKFNTAHVRKTAEALTSKYHS